VYCLDDHRSTSVRKYASLRNEGVAYDCWKDAKPLPLTSDRSTESLDRLTALIQIAGGCRALFGEIGCSSVVNTCTQPLGRLICGVGRNELVLTSSH
jgi:hypothetical protein